MDGVIGHAKAPVQFVEQGQGRCRWPSAPRHVPLPDGNGDGFRRRMSSAAPPIQASCPVRSTVSLRTSAQVTSTSAPSGIRRFLRSTVGPASCATGDVAHLARAVRHRGDVRGSFVMNDARREFSAPNVGRRHRQEALTDAFFSKSPDSCGAAFSELRSHCPTIADWRPRWNPPPTLLVNVARDLLRDALPTPLSSHRTHLQRGGDAWPRCEGGRVHR